MKEFTNVEKNRKVEETREWVIAVAQWCCDDTVAKCEVYNGNLNTAFYNYRYIWLSLMTNDSAVWH
jgi:hypothetical protein